MAEGNVIQFTKNSSGIHAATGILVSRNTVEALEALLDEALQGNIIGLAFVAMNKNRTFIHAAAGEAYRNPTFTRGMLASLDDELSQIIHDHG